jgi:hypothetical protein
MKLFCAILALIVGFSACGKIENFTNLTQQKIETENEENEKPEQPDAPPILEIVQEAKGMHEVIGKTLFFNLYENGVVEFEYEDQKKLVKGKTNRAEEVNTLMRAKLDKEELRDFLAQINAEDFQKVKNEYTRKCCCIQNATIDYKIHFQNGNKQKNINLNGYCDIGEFTNGRAPKIQDFPSILQGLLMQAHQARRKYNLEKSSNQTE